ncbi:FAD binding domain protein [Boeremia exigua]|uniref:FAD binding domain protein n=1 Tax=Boeremia exigua TaxID=749465 RepID=UPI001E8D570F|nr:FAD binding domain protein [Boeremia exigua]KAH6633730.1 FAD binding domain protein [Boeremia exigua]
MTGFRVIIAGGGIAGLTLANALEKANIDYVLLEARDTISPEVGASIGIFQNGARLLDQVGCLEAIWKETCALRLGRERNGQGIQYHEGDGVQLVEARTGYPALFVERERVLHIMYQNLRDKSKIELQKRISRVDHNENAVTVTCNDGTIISGDVLVGCDGVHSVVRQEMWRLAHLHEQNSFDPSDKEMLCAEYKCLFGISTSTDDTVTTRALPVTDKFADKSTELPRFTKKDAESFANDIQNYTITPELTFDKIWSNRSTYTLVPTEEAQLKRWSWGRIACVGDCIHKMTPNMGAGGNAAMETAAALANELKKMVDTAEKGKPSYDNVRAHLANCQKVRDIRLSAVLKAANDLTRMHALATLKDRFLAFWVLPNSGDFSSDLLSDMIIGAVKLDYLPTPERSFHGTMPFNPSQGLGQAESKLWRAVRALPFLAITAAATYFMLGICLPHIVERIGQILEEGVQNAIGEAVHVKMVHSFYGVEFLDSRFRSLTACFASFQFVDHVCSWQTLSFLTDVGIVYSILLIESARRANIMTLSYLPIILGYNMQFFGIGVLMALWCFVHYIQTPIENFRARDLRLTDLSYTASVLPVMLLTYYLPSLISFSAWVDPQIRHAADWIWQPFALWTAILQYLLKKTVMPDTIQQDRIKHPFRDLPVIKYTIYSLCAISVTTWWYTLYNAPFSFATLFIPNVAAMKTHDEFIRLFLQFDEVFSMGACLLWLLYLFGDLKRAGMVDHSWLSIVGRGVVTFAATGPGVTFGLGWWWREQLLATKWHKDAIVAGKSK